MEIGKALYLSSSKILRTGNQIGYILMRIDESVISVRSVTLILVGSQIFVLNSDNTVVSSAGDYADVAAVP